MAIWCDGIFKRYTGVLRRARERAATGLASKCLNGFSMALFAIAHQSADSSVSDAKVKALLVGTGEASGVYPLGELPVGFSTHTRDATSIDAVPSPVEGVKPRRQAGQPSGVRGWRCRRSVLSLAPPGEEEG